MSKGVESIRIKGQAIQDLPLGLGNGAKAQLPAAIEHERLNNIATINANFPTHRIDYLTSRINECRENKTRMDRTTDEQNTMISDYKGHIAMCKHRDKEVAKLDESADDFKAKKKALFKQFLPYNVEAMEQQIVQCREAIERCHKVKDAEDKSIEEFSAARALCNQRDKELAAFGAVAEG
jgi:hypothetical protein